MGRAVDEAKCSRLTATADMTFLPPEQGGRRTPPILTRQYMPHIVVQSSDIRHVKVGQEGFCREPLPRRMFRRRSSRREARCTRDGQRRYYSNPSARPDRFITRAATG